MKTKSKAKAGDKRVELSKLLHAKRTLPRFLTECPRCLKPHNVRAKKLKRPMQMDHVVSTYWAMCPNTKEPVIFFWPVVSAETQILNAIAKQASDEIAAHEDQVFLSTIANMTFEKQKKGGMKISAKWGGGKKQEWEYTMTPGTPVAAKTKPKTRAKGRKK